MVDNNNVCIVADTGSDMIPADAEKLEVVLLAMTVRFGDEEFEDGITLSRDDFYHRLIESDELPKTSQITPYRYEAAFRKAVEEGKDVVCLTISSGVSGCYQSACLAAEEFEGRVFVVDTKQFCGPEYLLVRRAAEFRDAGMSARVIAEAIEREREEPRVIALFDTLEYLKMGGRISAAAASIGGLLSLKPVVTIEDGVVRVVGKARGSKNGNNYLMNFIREHGGINMDRPCVLSWSGLSDHLLEKYAEDSAALYDGRSTADIPRMRVGATVGTYSGPGAVAFSFYPKN